MIDLTGFPPVRRRTSGVLSIDAHSLRSRFRKEGVGATDARDPHRSVGAGKHRPPRPTASRHPRVLKAANQQPSAGAAERAHPLARGPAANDERGGREPRRESAPLLAGRRGLGPPAKAPPSPLALALVRAERPSRQLGSL